MPRGRELGDLGGVCGAEVPQRLAVGADEQVLPHVPPLEVAQPRVAQRVAESQGTVLGLETGC